MGILLATLTLLTGAGALTVLRALRPSFRFSWLLALGASLAATTSALILHAQLPSQLVLPLWHSHISSAAFASFTVTGATWPSIFGIAILEVSVLLAAPGRPRFPAPATWALCLMFGGLGVLALSADNPLTLVLVWAALDLAEAGLLLSRLENRAVNRHVAFGFTMRLVSMGLVMLAFVLGEASTASAQFSEIRSPIALGLLPVAALIRLGAFASPWPKGLGDADDLGTMLQLTAGAAAVGFLAQVPASAGNLSTLVFNCAATLYASWMLLRAGDLQEARPLWIMSIGTLAVAAAILAKPTGSAAWGCAMLLAGGPLFLGALRGKWERRAILLVLWILSGLPFSLTASAWSPSVAAWEWTMPVFLLGQAILLTGSFYRALESQVGTAMRVEVVALQGLQYASGGLPILSGILLGLFGWTGAMQIGAPMAILIVIPITAGLVMAKRRLPILNPASAERYPGWLKGAANSLGQEIARLEVSAQRLVAAFTRTIEGEAGIMWGLLFLVLFVSLIAGARR